MANECAAIRLGLQTIVKALKKEMAGKKKKHIKHFIKELKDHIEQVNKDLSPENVRGATDVYLKNIADNSSKRLLHVINDQTAYVNGVEFLDSMLGGVKFRESVMSVIENLFENLRISMTQQTLRLDKAWEDLIENAHLRGFDAEEVIQVRNMYQEHQRGGNHLINALAQADDIPLQGDQAQVAILEALSLGFYKRGGKQSKILNIIGATHKKWDEVLTRILDDIGVPFKARKNYSVPSIEDPDIVRRMDYADYKKEIMEDMDLDQMFAQERRALGEKKYRKYLNEWVENRFETTKEKGEGGNTNLNKTNRLDVSRQVIYKSLAHEANHFMKFRQPGADILREAHEHKRRMVRKGALYAQFGSNPEAMVSKLSNYVKDKDVIREMFGLDIKDVTAKFEELAKSSGAKETGFHQHDTVLQAFVSGASRLMSAGLVWKSTIRDILYDRTLHSATLRAPFTGESPLLGWFKTIGAITKDIKSTADSRMKEKMFNDVGISTKFSMAALIRGEEALGKAAADYTRYGILHKIDDLANKISVLTLADAIARASRVFEATNAGRIIMKIFDQPFSKLNNSERHMLTRSGIDRVDFENIGKAKRLKFEGDDIMIDADSIKGSKKGKGIETQQEYARTLKRKYLIMHESMVNDFSTIVTTFGQPPTVEGYFAPIAKLITKFYGMPLSQYRALLHGTQVAAGLKPMAGFSGDIKGVFGLAKSPAGLGMVGSRVILGTIAGLMIEWFSDLFNGRAPRDIDLAFLAKAFSTTGMGGFPALVAGDAVYSDDIVGTPLQAYFSGVKRIVTSPFRKEPGKAFGRAVHDLAGKTPGPNLWFARGFVNWIFDSALDLGTKREINAAKEAGDEYFWRIND